MMHVPSLRRQRGRALLWLGGLLGAVIAVLIWMPAAWLTGAVSRASQGRVVLDEPRGTVWGGSARLVLTGGEGSRDVTSLPGRLEWTLRPMFDGAHIEVRMPCCSDQPVAVAAYPGFSGSQVVVGPAQMRLPMGLLAGLGTPWNTVQLQGDLSMSTAGVDLNWDQGRMTSKGKVRLEAADVASRLSTLKPLGSYRVDYSAAGVGTNPTITLETIKGDLRMSGQGQWTGPRLRFEGEASAVPGREAALANLLSIIGRRRGDRSIITVG